MIIHIPGKTFLLGEYAVLQGGSALIACTKPYFTLCASKKNLDLFLPPSRGKVRKGEHNLPFHSESPAGKFILDHPETFKSLNLTWSSPYPQGGFGGSTAEFLACYQFHHHINNLSFSFNELYKTYLSYAYKETGTPPSGADLIAQTQEKIVYFQPQKSPISLNWPFEDLSLLLFKTPHKLPTHQHLETLKNLPDLASLSHLTQQGYEALQEKNRPDFIQTMNDYASQLNQLHLTTELTQTLLQKLKQHPACLAIKGCGALGADVIAAIISTTQENEFIALSQTCQLTLIATQINL